VRRWILALVISCGCGTAGHHGTDGEATSDGHGDGIPSEAADVTSDTRDDIGNGGAFETAADRTGDTTDTADAADAATDVGDAGDSSEAAHTDTGPACDAGDAGLSGAVGTWQQFGAALGDSADAPLLGPALTLLPDDRPVVSWFEGTGIQTRIWEVTACGGRWIDPGPITGDSPALVTDAQGAPVLAFDAYAAQPSHVSVMRFDGSSFAPLGAPLPSTNHGAARAVAAPSLAADGAGNLVLTWIDFPSSTNATVQVARWSGTVWVPMTDAGGALGLLGSGSPSGASVAIAPDGSVLASWLTVGHATAVARYVSGTTWTSVGTPPSGAAGGGENNGPLLALGKTGVINLAWKDRTAPSTYHTFVAQYDGAVWTPLGGALATAGSAGGDYTLMVDATDAPVVINAENLTPQPGNSGFNYRWNGTAWKSPAPVLQTPVGGGGISAPRLLSDHQGRWVAAWLEFGSAAGMTVVVGRWQP
jgi:hypothetical protein